jgi:hypothetical protein
MEVEGGGWMDGAMEEDGGDIEISKRREDKYGGKKDIAQSHSPTLHHTASRVSPSTQFNTINT